MDFQTRQKLNAAAYAVRPHGGDARSLEESLKAFRDNLGLGIEFHDVQYTRWKKDQIFMSMAFVLAKGSHDSQTQHGCVIVDENNHIVSSGFNCFLPDSPDSIMPNIREGGHKYKFMMHAEANGCDHATRASLKGCRVYVTGVPCNECLKRMINKGIREIIIGDIGHKFEDGFWELHHFLVKIHGVTIRKYVGEIVDTSKTRFVSST